MRDLIIDRSRWSRGETGDRSMLLRECDNKMCCLGFHALACGLDEDDILNLSEPQELDYDVWSKFENEFDGILSSENEYEFEENGYSFHETLQSVLIDQLIQINDNQNLDEKEREKQITEIFAEIGWRVTFV